MYTFISQRSKRNRSRFRQKLQQINPEERHQLRGMVALALQCKDARLLHFRSIQWGYGKYKAVVRRECLMINLYFALYATPGEVVQVMGELCRERRFV
jgi:hypothetical protein